VLGIADELDDAGRLPAMTGDEVELSQPSLYYLA
jgi:hypothetical protein